MNNRTTFTDHDGKQIEAAADDYCYLCGEYVDGKHLKTGSIIKYESHVELQWAVYCKKCAVKYYTFLRENVTCE